MLLIDDNPMNLHVVGRQLVALGMRVETASSAIEGLRSMRAAVAEASPFDLALVDHMMPDVDGPEFARRVRADRIFATTTLVLSSSSGMINSDAAAQAYECDAALPKPLHGDTVALRLARIMGAQIGRDDVGADVAPIRSVRSLRVLLADDNKVNQMLGTRLLTKVGHRVDVVANGIEAVEAVGHRQYDVVLMDMLMPEMDGLEATRRIRALPTEVNRIPIIAMTASVMLEDRVQCEAAGMNGYVAKPIDVSVLMHEIARCTGQDLDAEPISEVAAPPPIDPASTSEAESALAGLLDSLPELDQGNGNARGSASRAIG